MTEWIGAVGTILTLIGAAFSWWRANKSKTAKLDAERARADAETARSQAQDAARRAEETLAEVRRQTAALETVAAALQQPPLRFEHNTGILWRLRNTTKSEIAIDRLANVTEFVGRPFDWPVVIQPGGAIEVRLIDVNEVPLPASMELQIRGSNETLRVPMPPSQS